MKRPRNPIRPLLVLTTRRYSRALLSAILLGILIALAGVYSAWRFAPLPEVEVLAAPRVYQNARWTALVIELEWLRHRRECTAIFYHDTHRWTVAC